MVSAVLSRDACGPAEGSLPPMAKLRQFRGDSRAAAKSDRRVAVAPRRGRSLACAAPGGEAMLRQAASQARLGPSAGGGEVSLRYLHTMVRGTNIEQRLD